MLNLFVCISDRHKIHNYDLSSFSIGNDITHDIVLEINDFDTCKAFSSSGFACDCHDSSLHLSLNSCVPCKKGYFGNLDARKCLPCPAGMWIFLDFVL